MSLTIDLSHSNALVTGVSSGIGLGIADVLAQSGCNVFGCGQRAAESYGVRRFLETVRARGMKAGYTSIDISHAEAPQRLVDEAVAVLGGVDLVVSNAGRNVFEGVDACDLEAWNACMDLDLRSHWLLARARSQWDRRSRSMHAFHASRSQASTPSKTLRPAFDTTRSTPPSTATASSTRRWGASA